MSKIVDVEIDDSVDWDVARSVVDGVVRDNNFRVDFHVDFEVGSCDAEGVE